MSKYYVIKKQNDNTDLLEIIEAKNLKEARKHQYKNIWILY